MKIYIFICVTSILLITIVQCQRKRRTPKHFPGQVWTKMWSNFTGDARKDSGSHILADIKDYPYQASLRVNGTHYCGASLISSTWLITAAHCISSPVQKLSVRLGSNDHTSGGNIYRINKKIPHPDYNSRNFNNDIGLVRIKAAAVGNPGIDVIELPKHDLIVPIDTFVTVSGWGEASNEANSYLQAVNLPLLSQSNCQSLYGEGSIIESMLCAGYTTGETESCQGDSGGPMVVTINSSKQLIGIVSWGESCSLPNYPGVYTRVSSFREWIKENSKV